MQTFLLIVSCLVGLLLGRMYGWMKYHYPESQEMIKLKVAKLRSERARYEAQTERHRSEIDDQIEERIWGHNR